MADGKYDKEVNNLGKQALKVGAKYQKADKKAEELRTKLQQLDQKKNPSESDLKKIEKTGIAMLKAQREAQRYLAELLALEKEISYLVKKKGL